MSNIIKVSQIPEKAKETMLDMGMDEQKFIIEAKFACDIWNNPKNAYLQKSDKTTFYNSIVNIAQIGLTLNPVAEETYLIPRYDSLRKSVICCLEPSYKGIQKLLFDSGFVNAIQTNLVYEGDDFDVNLGMDTEIKHKPYYVVGKKKGGIVGVYSIVKLSSGEKQFEFMPMDEIEQIKLTSESYKAFKSGKAKSAIWNDYEGEMIKKTCIKRIAKYVPKTQATFLHNAISLDNDSYKPSMELIGLIESKLGTSRLIESVQDEILRQLPTMTTNAAKNTLDYLNDNQLDPIRDGGSFGQKEIQEELDKKMLNEKA